MQQQQTDNLIKGKCPYCRADGLQRRGGRVICAYCLEWADDAPDELSEGFRLLAAYEFDAAVSFFEKENSAVGAYGLFLAAARIDEQRTRDGKINPLILSHAPEPFTQNRYYKNAVRLCGGDVLLFERLKQIEAAREQQLQARADADVLIRACPRTVAAAKALSAALERFGYAPRIADSDEFRPAALRDARAMFMLFESEAAFYEHKSTGSLRRFMAFELPERDIQKTPVILAAFHDADVVHDADTKRARWLHVDFDDFDPSKPLSVLTLPRPKRSSNAVLSEAAPQRAQAASFVLKEREPFRAAPLPLKANEAVDLSRVRKLLSGGDFDGAAKLIKRLKSDANPSGEAYFAALLCDCRAADEQGFIRDLPALNPDRAQLFHEAVSRSGDTQTADRYAGVLLAAAEANLSIGRRAAAEPYIRAVYAYALPVTDSRAGSLLSAILSGAESDEFIPVHELYTFILDRARTADGEFQLSRRRAFAEYALSKRQFYAAEHIADALLAVSPLDQTLSELKLLCLNGACSLYELYETPTAKLGEPFRRVLSACPDNRAVYRHLLDTFDGFLEGAVHLNGITPFTAVFEELLRYTVEDRGVPAARILALADAALALREFETAYRFYVRATETDAGAYAAYLGMLYAEFGACDARELVCSPRGKDALCFHNYFENAYTYASEAGDTAFVQALDRLHKSLSGVKRRGNHIFSAVDYEIAAGEVVRYIGTGVAEIYIPATVFAVAAGAFKGAKGIRSVYIESGVSALRDEAFADCPDLTEVTLPDSAAITGTNPFAGCKALSTVHTDKKYRVEGGVLYNGGTALAALSTLPARVTLPAGTAAIGAKCFFGMSGLTEIILPPALKTVGAAAFHGCSLTQMRVAGASFTPDAMGASPLYDRVIQASGAVSTLPPDWDSLFGSAYGNFALPVVQPKNPADRVSLMRTDDGVRYGALVRAGHIVVAAGRTVTAVPVEGGKAHSFSLPEEVAGTGVLYRDCLVLPLCIAGCTLVWFNAGGKAVGRVPVPGLSRSLIVYDRYILAVAGTRLTVICADSCAVIKTFEAHSEILCAPVLYQRRGVPKAVYATQTDYIELDLNDLTERKVYRIAGLNIAKNMSSRILRNRLVSSGDAVFAVERRESGYVLTAYNGETLAVSAVPPALSGAHITTCPVVTGSRVYLGTGDGVLAATRTERHTAEGFARIQKESRRVKEIAVMGQRLFCLTDQDEGVMFKAAANGRAILANAGGEIYAVKI